MIKLGYITHENGEYVAHSESGRVFGRYKSKEEAKKRIQQMEMFKHMKKTAAGPKLKNFFASEPSCIVHGAGTQCVTSKGPNFAKKAEYTFNKLAQEKLNIVKEPGKGFYDATVVKGFNTKAGLRYYSGTSSSQDQARAHEKAIFNARIKSVQSPADSITTQQFKDFNLKK